jgi:hypothetical protein
MIKLLSNCESPLLCKVATPAVAQLAKILQLLRSPGPARTHSRRGALERTTLEVVRPERGPPGTVAE